MSGEELEQIEGDVFSAPSGQRGGYVHGLMVAGGPEVGQTILGLGCPVGAFSFGTQAVDEVGGRV